MTFRFGHAFIFITLYKHVNEIQMKTHAYLHRNLNDLSTSTTSTCTRYRTHPCLIHIHATTSTQWLQLLFTSDEEIKAGCGVMQPVKEFPACPCMSLTQQLPHRLPFPSNLQPSLCAFTSSLLSFWRRSKTELRSVSHSRFLFLFLFRAWLETWAYL